MKKLNYLWCAVALLGLFLAICTADGSECEIGLRIIGVVCFGIGAYLGGWMDLTKE